MEQQNSQNIEKITVGEEEQKFLNKVLVENPTPPVQEQPKVEPVQAQPEPKPEPATNVPEPKPQEEKTVEGYDEDNVRVSYSDPMIECRHVVANDMEKSKIKDPNYEGEINYPSGTFKQYVDFFSKLPQSEEEMANYVKKIGDISGSTVALNALSDRTTILNNVYVDSLNDPNNEYVNGLEFGGAKLNTRSINISTNVKLTQESALARIYGLLGVGEVVQVPLWHSGIWVTIRPIKQKDFVNLYNALTISTVRLGRDTNSLIYSNYSVIFTRIVTEFILANITEHTLDLKDDESLLDFIKVQDLYPLANGIISAMYPKGLDIVKSCVNSLKLDPKTNEPLCDYSIAAKVDSKKLLWVNRKALDKYMINHMSKRTAGSVSSAEVKEYQERLRARSTTVVSGTSTTGTKVDFTMKVPYLREYIDAGEKWVQTLISDTEKLYTPQDTDQDKVTKLSDAIMASRLSTYHAYIEKVTFTDTKGVETTFDNSDAIKEVLDTISGDQDLFMDVLNHIGKFFTNSAIAVVATPNFICPKCQASQGEPDTAKPFKEFIPLNVIENFFDLGGLRKEGMKAKGLW